MKNYPKIGFVILAGIMVSCSSKQLPEETIAPPSMGPISPAEISGLKVDGYTQAPPNSCQGFFDSVNPQDLGTIDVAGWAYLPLAKAKPSKVVVASADGKVLGTAALTVPRPDVKQNMPGIAEMDTGFKTRVTIPSHMNVRIFAVLEDGKQVCPLYNQYKQP